MQAVNWGAGESLSRKPLETRRVPIDRTLFVNGISALTSFMAREGIIDPYEGTNRYLQSAKEYHDNRAHVTGLDFIGYSQQKVALKTREFGINQNHPQHVDIHPADKAIADVYRKLSDGE